MNPMMQSFGAKFAGKLGAEKADVAPSPWRAKIQRQKAGSRVQGTRQAPQARPAMIAPPQRPAVVPGAAGGFSRVAR